MSRPLGRVPGLVLAVLATVGAYHGWRDARASRLLARYGELAQGNVSSASARGIGEARSVPPESAPSVDSSRGDARRESLAGAPFDETRAPQNTIDAGADTPDGGRAVRKAGIRTDSARRMLLLRAIEQGGVTSEARTSLAIERVAAASTLAVSDASSSLGSKADAEGYSRRESSRQLLYALSDVREALQAFPGDSQAWLAGYRVIETAGIVGLDVLGDAAPPLRTSERSRRLVIFDPASITDLREGLRDPSRLTATFIDGAIRSDPNGGSLQHQIGTVMLEAGHPEDAFTYLARAARDLSASPVRIANEMLDGGYSPEAVLDVMPRRFDAQVRVGGLLLSKHFEDLAERAFLEAARLEPNVWEPWAALAQLAESRGRHQEALDFTKRAIPVMPERDHAACSRILFCAAQASRELGDLPNAIAYGSRALRDDPRRVSLYHFMGSLLSDSGDDAGAIHHWQSLIDDHPSDPYVIANLAQLHRLIGRSYERLGMRTRAVEHYLDALRASPRDAEARAALQRLTRP